MKPGLPPIVSPQNAATSVPQEERHGIALCLSGGGFRATLFHLGALRRLNEIGLIPKLRSISSVSGGSIVAAHMATALAHGGALADWDRAVVAPLLEFTSGDRRTKPILARLLPWNWFKSDHGVHSLAAEYEAHLTPLRLVELPETPNFVLCATDMPFGVNWVFERSRMGDFKVGYLSPPPNDWPLALAVAASSCFPPVFNPLRVRLDPLCLTGGMFPAGTRRDRLLRDMRLTDGGDYDNLGLEPVWKSHAMVLVSDGGAPFDVSEDQGLFWRVARYSAILGNQAHALRVRWLIASYDGGVFRGTYWGVRSAPASYGTGYAGYSKALATDVIAKIRTDLDAFSDAEAAVLENHGYWLTEAALRAHVPQLVPPGAPVARAPHSEWMDEQRVRTALASSAKRRLFGRS